MACTCPAATFQWIFSSVPSLSSSDSRVLHSLLNRNSVITNSVENLLNYLPSMQCTNSQAVYYARDVEKQQRRRKTCKETCKTPPPNPAWGCRTHGQLGMGTEGPRRPKTPSAGYQSYAQHLSGAGRFWTAAVLIHG